MTALQALEHISATCHAAYWHRNEAAPPCHLLLCQDCTVALLRALEKLCRPTIQSEPITLAGSQLMGCTFGQGTKEQCALHEAIREEAA